MEIIFTEPIYKDYIWGGYRLKKDLNKNTPFEKTAESWEISCNSNGICIIKNGEYAGTLLSDLYADISKKEMIFGTNCNKYNEFPILIKFIDAMNNLSIQVHPDDEYAKSIGLPNGKNEMWYIIDCAKDSKLVAGMNKALNKEELRNVIENDKIKDYLNYVTVKQGDSVYIPAGTLHAILSNILICEIQQNSDTTYRVYDWDRVDKNGNSRQLHKKEAIDTINPKYVSTITHSNNDEIQKLASNNVFEVNKIVCKNKYESTTSASSFEAYCVVNGSGTIDDISIKQGDSFIIPACYGKFKILGNIELLKTIVK